MAFTIDRLEASRRLGVSTRTVDRFIQTGRIATKRIGKKVFLDEDDVARVKEENIGYTPDEYEVIQNNESDEDFSSLSNFPVPNGYHVDYRDLYEQSQENIEKKDALIQDLSYKLWKAETELKNSISLLEYRKATFLLESAKEKTEVSTKTLESEIRVLHKELKNRNSVIIGLSILFVIALAFSALFVLFVQWFFS